METAQLTSMGKVPTQHLLEQATTTASMTAAVILQQPTITNAEIEIAVWRQYRAEQECGNHIQSIYMCVKYEGNGARSTPASRMSSTPKPATKHSPFLERRQLYLERHQYIQTEVAAAAILAFIAAAAVDNTNRKIDKAAAHISAVEWAQSAQTLAPTTYHDG